MSLTVYASPTHVLPQLDMPVLKDAKGAGAMAYRRKWPRGLSSWELAIPGRQDLLDPILGLLEFAQGDTPVWFDGAGFGEIVSPILLMIGDGTTTDILLPHRYWNVVETVIYINDAPTNVWAPLASADGIWMDSIRLTGAPSLNTIVTGKSRRKIKCVLRVEDKVERQRQFRNSSTSTDSIYALRLFLDEVAQ